MTLRRPGVRRYRIRWSILVTRLFFAAALAGLASLALRGVPRGLEGSVAITSRTSTVIVQPGDSLWSIAMEVTEPGQDGRRVVEHLRTLNGITGTVIHPGASLLVPSRRGGPSGSEGGEAVACVPAGQAARRKS